MESFLFPMSHKVRQLAIRRGRVGDGPLNNLVGGRNYVFAPPPPIFETHFAQIVPKKPHQQKFFLKNPKASGGFVPWTPILVLIYHFLYCRRAAGHAGPVSPLPIMTSFLRLCNRYRVDNDLIFFTCPLVPGSSYTTLVFPSITAEPSFNSETEFRKT